VGVATIWQNAPAISLEAGCYEGLTTIAELKRHGDFGIGAFDQLDGELVAVDGVFYRLTADSKAHAAGDSDTVAFGMVTAFAGAERLELPAGTGKDALTGFLDERLPSRNFYYAIRVEGAFDTLATRSLPRQSKPFPPMAEVTKTQPTFVYERAEGTMAGFRAPAYVGHMAPPGDHLHFVSADRTVGGHVLSFAGAEATVAFAAIERQEIAYPLDGEFASAILT
jgi:acetolactate decarboxylase